MLMILVTEDATTPDEFERELDAMLASVSGGKVFNTPTGRMYASY